MHLYKNIKYIILIFIFSFSDLYAEKLSKKYEANLLAYYNFDQFQGRVLEDQSKRKNHAQISGTDSFWYEEGIFGSSGKFKEGTRIIVNNNRRFAKGSELTIMMWVKPLKDKKRMTLISKRSYEKEFYYYIIGINKLRPFAALSDNMDIIATPKIKSIAINEWTHVAMVLEEKKLKLYINGKLLELVDTYKKGFNSLNANLSIGSDFQGAEGYFEGLIDELMIFNKQVKASEVLEEVNRSNLLLLKNATKEIIVKDSKKFLSGFWPLDDGRGSVAKNILNNNHFGKLSFGLESNWNEGFLSNSLYFNGINNFVQIKHYDGINFTRSFSVFCWVKPKNFKGDNKIFSKVAIKNKNKFCCIGELNGVLYAGYGNGKKGILTNKKINLKLNKWQHVGMIFDEKKSRFKIIYNGEIKEELVTDFSALTSKAPITIGADLTSSNSFFNGNISNLKIYQVAVPVKLIKDEYNEVKNKLIKIIKDRSARLQIREELKVALKRLHSLNEILNEKDSIEIQNGEEYKNLAEINKLIKTKLTKIEKRRNTELTKLNDLIKVLKSKLQILNNVLTELNQKEHSINIPTINNDIKIEEIIKLSSQIKSQTIELNLLIKQKNKSLDLKKELLRKKYERMHTQISLNINLINEINVELGLNSIKIDSTRLEKSKSDEYLNEIKSLLKEKERKRELTIIDLKKKINTNRQIIDSLYKSLKDYSSFINKPKPNKIDYVSPLPNNISRLKSIYSNENLTKSDFSKKLINYKDESNAMVLSKKNDLKKIINEVKSLYDELSEIYNKLNIKNTISINILDKDIDSISSFDDLVSTFNTVQTLKEQIIDELSETQKNYFEVKKSSLVNEYNNLKKKNKIVKNKLFIINSELNINEKWKNIILNLESKKTTEKILAPKIYFNFDNSNEERLSNFFNENIFLNINNFFSDNFVEGKYGNALEFKGINNYFTLNSSDLFFENTSFSISFWLYITRFWGDRTIFVLANKKDMRLFELYFSEKVLLMKVLSKSNEYKVINPQKLLNLRNWTHFCLNFDKATKKVKLFINGQEIDVSIKIDISNKDYSFIFGTQNTRSQFFVGLLDELKIYNRSLNVEEINASKKAYVGSDIKDQIKMIEQVNNELDSQITKISNLIKERSILIQKQKEEEEKRRQELILKINETIKKLNKCHSIIGLPRYPLKTTVAVGREDALLKKFQTELKTREEEVRRIKEKELMELDRQKKNYLIIRTKLNDLNTTLNQSKFLKEFDKDSYKNDITKMKQLIIQKRQLIIDKQKKEREQNIAKLDLIKSKRFEKIQNLLGKVKDLLTKINDINIKLNIDALKVNYFKYNILKEEKFLAYYKFDTISKYMLPDSFGGKVIEIYGEGDLKSVGRYKSCLKLNGKNNYCLIPLEQLSKGHLNTFFWVKPLALSKKKIILSFKNSINDNHLSLVLYQSSLFFESRLNDKKIKRDTNIILNKNEWQHIALSINRYNQSITIYINGTKTWNDSIKEIPENLEFIHLGGDGIQNSRYLNALIDEFKIYYYILNEVSISQSGVESNEVTLDYKVLKLNELIKDLSNKLTLKEKELEQYKVLKQQQELKEKAEFLEKLKVLNELLSKMGEPQEKFDSFADYSSEYRIKVIDSKIKIAKESYKVFHKEQIEKDIAKKEFEKRKKFNDISNKIEKTWLDLEPIIKELNIELKKPEYDMDSALNVYSKLTTLHKKYTNELIEFREKRKIEFIKSKNKLQNMYKDLKNIAQIIKEPLIFSPSYEEKDINQSIIECKNLLSEYTIKLNEYNESRKQAELDAINNIRNSIHYNYLKLLKLNEKLNLETVFKPLNVITNKPSGLLLYFEFNDNIENYSFDWEQSVPFYKNDVKTLNMKSSNFLNSIIFDKNTSYMELNSKDSIKQSDFYLISLNVKAYKFWEKRSILYVKLNGDYGIDIFTEINKLNMRLLKNNIDIKISEGNSIKLNSWNHIIIDFNLSRRLINLYNNNEIQCSMKLSADFKLNGLIRLGSKFTEQNTFNGQIAQFKLFNKRLSPLERKSLTKRIIPKYSKEARQQLDNYLKDIKNKITLKQKSLENIIQEKELKRKKVLEEIDLLKKELKKLTNQDKILMTVVIGEEEKALNKLKLMIKDARIKLQKENEIKEAKRLKILEKIKLREVKTKKLMKILKIDKLDIKYIQGEEVKYLKEIIELNKKLEEEKLTKELQIQQWEAKYKNLSKQLGVKDISLPKFINIPDYLDSLYTLIKDSEDKINALKREKLINKWEAQYKTYSALMNEMNLKPKQLSIPEKGGEMKALKDISLLVKSTKVKLKKIQLEREEVIRKKQSTFELLFEELKSLLKELGEEDISIIEFDSFDPDKSIDELKKIIQMKNELLEKRKIEQETQLERVQDSVEAIQKAIEDEKQKILSHAKELNLRKYQIPTILSDKIIKSLFSYYKFDSLKKKYLFDEMEVSKKSFLNNYALDVKVEGKFGFGAQLNGLDQFLSIDLQNVLVSENVTFAFWFNPLRTYGKRILITAMNEGYKSGFSIYFENKSLIVEFIFNGKSIFYKSDIIVNKKTWSHIIFTLKASNKFLLYYNSKLIINKSINDKFKNCITDHLIIGSDYKKALNMFAGVIDEFKIYNNELQNKELKSSMEEETIGSDLEDIELLKEEYSLLKAESDKLLKKVKEKIKIAAEIRITKINKINDIKKVILEINQKMGLPPLNFTYKSGEEDKAIKELNKIKTNKLNELKLYEENIEIQQKKFRDEAEGLVEKIGVLHIKLGIDKEYEIELQTGLEKEILTKAKEYLRELESEYETLIETQKERQKLKLHKEINKFLTELNEKRASIDLSAFNLPEIKDNEIELIKMLKSEIKDVNKKIEEKKKLEKLKELQKKKELLISQYFESANEIENLHKELNIITKEPYVKSENPNVEIYLNFNEGKGNIIHDQSKYGNNGIFKNYNFKWIETGIYDKCIAFLGTKSILEIEENSTFNDINNFSVLFWMNPSNLIGEKSIFTIGKDEKLRFALELKNGDLILNFGPKKLVDTGVKINKDKWSHICLLFNKIAKRIDLYLNGVIVSQLDYPETLLEKQIFSNNSIYIGSNGSDKFFTGLFDEYKLFSMILKPDEILENKREGISVTDSTLKDLSINEIKSKLKKLENVLVSLRKQKEIRLKIKRQKRKELKKELDDIKELEMEVNKGIVETLTPILINLRNEMNISDKEIPPINKENMNEILDSLNKEYYELITQKEQSGFLPSFIKKFPYDKKFKSNEKILTEISFDNYNNESFNDQSGNNNNFEIFPLKSPVIEKSEINKNCLYLDGENYVKCNLKTLVPYNLMQAFQVFIKPKASALKESIIFTRGNITLKLLESRLLVIIGSEKIDFKILGTLQTNNWYLITLNINEFFSKVQASLNNNIGASKGFNSSIDNSSKEIFIGGNNSGQNNFKGHIDELRIWHRILYLNDYDIKAIYNCNVNGVFSGSFLQTILLEISAQNAHFMKVYQEGYMKDSIWEKYRKNKVLRVYKPINNDATIPIIIQLKNSKNNEIKELKTKIDIPIKKDIEYISPIPGVDLTTR